MLGGIVNLQGFFVKKHVLERMLTSGLAAGLMLCLSGCGLLAAPCRVVSAGLKIVPVVGHVAAVPTDTCAAVIDP